jgi:hypothetical protein
MTKWVSFIMLLAPLAQAQPTTFYYSGTMYMNYMATDEVKKSDYLLSRTLDDENNQITEVITSKPGEVPYGEATVAYKIDGSDYSFAAKEMTGTGQLSGSPWKWSKMTGSFSLENDVTSARIVETVNLSDPQTYVRHVDVYRDLGDGGPQVLAEQIDIIVNRVPSYIYLLGREKLIGHL